MDDDDEGVQTFARIPKLEGDSVRTALTAEMGFSAAQLNHDLHMPLVDGLGFLRRLRSHDAQRDTPVAIVTTDYFLDDSISNEIKGLGAQVTHNPLFFEELVGLARLLLEVIH